MDLYNTWVELLSRDLPDGISRRRVPSAPDTDVHVAVRSPEGSALLLIGVDPESAAGFRGFEAEALTATIEELRVGAPHVCVELSDPTYLDIFESLARDLLARVDGCDSAETTSVIANRIGRWHDLMSRRRRGLTIEQQRGLIGELEVLHLLVGGEKWSPVEVLQSWRGPDGGLHDFVFDDRVVEVKSRGHGSTVRINHVDQLWPAEHTSRLLLAVVEITDDPDPGQLLRDHVERARGAFAGAGDESVTLLETLLRSAGWRDGDGGRYATHWAVGEVELHDVRDGYPRIDPEQLPAGTLVRRYTLDTSVVPDDFRLELETLTSAPTGHTDGTRDD